MLHRDVAALVVGLAVFGLLFAFFRYTRIGLALRAEDFAPTREERGQG